VPQWIELTNREHAQILDAMRKRRHQKAASLMQEHVVNSGEGLVGFLESQGVQLE
jgi:DNA-binding GntR family transcriptional regulator